MLDNGSQMILLGWIRTRETELQQKAQKASNRLWYLKKSIRLYLRGKKKKKKTNFFQRDRLIDSFRTPAINATQKFI